MTGPVLRSAGVAADLRKDTPYSGYETYDFDVPVEQGGDVWSRYLVRMREMVESNKIIRQALDRLRPEARPDALKKQGQWKVDAGQQARRPQGRAQ